MNSPLASDDAAPISSEKSLADSKTSPLGTTESAPASKREEAEPSSIYSRHEKALIIVVVSVAATFSGFASNIYFPSLPTIAANLNVSVELVNTTITSYLILQGLSPSFWGALADVKGRRLSYILTFLVFFAACIALANTKNFAMLVGLRCLQSAGSASTIAIGSGVIGDITTRAERGGLMGIFQAALMAPVAVGPVIGGAIANRLGWRAIFWFLTIYSGVFLVFLALLLPETLHAIVGNGSVPGKGVAKFPLNVFQQRYRTRYPGCKPQTASELPPRRSINILGSFEILIDRRVLPIIAFLAVYYAAWQMSITVLAQLFQDEYSLNETQLGLTFLANGCGCILGTFSTGKLLDWDYARIKQASEAAHRPFPLDRARLRTVWLWSAMQMSALLAFGWTVDRRVPLAVPVVCTFFTGWAAMSVQGMVATYLVDVFPRSSASATAALNLARCLVAAGGTAGVEPLLSAIGVGWGFTTLVAVMGAALGLVAVQIAFGRRWREGLESREYKESTQNREKEKNEGERV